MEFCSCSSSSCYTVHLDVAEVHDVPDVHNPRLELTLDSSILSSALRAGVDDRVFLSRFFDFPTDCPFESLVFVSFLLSGIASSSDL
jgi:hypothetical protein